MLDAIGRSGLFCLLPFGAFSDGPEIDEVSHERSALTLLNFDPRNRSEAGRSIVTVTPIVLTRSDGNHRFYDLRRCRRGPSAGHTFLRCAARGMTRRLRSLACSRLDVTDRREAPPISMSPFTL
jgi:hypothetical protein